MKPKILPDDPAQSKRFIEVAKEVDAKEDPSAFEKVFKKVIKRVPSSGPAKSARK